MLTTKYAWSFMMISIAVACPLMIYGIVNYSWAMIVLALLWIFIWAVVFTVLDVNRINRIKDSADKECRPDKAIREYEQLLEKKHFRATRSAALMGNMLALLIHNGQDQRALDLIPILEKKGKGKNALMNQTAILNNRCLIYIHRGDYDMASGALEEAKRNMRNPEFSNYPAAQKLSCEKAITMKTYMLNILTGKTDGGESYLRSQLDITAPSCEKVTLIYLLGIICELESRSEEAVSYFTEGNESGGSTWAAEKCKEKLA